MDDVAIEMLALIFCMASSIAMAQIMITDVVIIIIFQERVINVKYLCTGCVGNCSCYIQALSLIYCLQYVSSTHVVYYSMQFTLYCH